MYIVAAVNVNTTNGKRTKWAYEMSVPLFIQAHLQKCHPGPCHLSIMPWVRLLFISSSLMLLKVDISLESELMCDKLF